MLEMKGKRYKLCGLEKGDGVDDVGYHGGARWWK